MFTGIVQARVALHALIPQPGGVRLVIDTTKWSPIAGYQPACGDSICISGVCLTVVQASPTQLQFDVIVETLAKTKLGDLRQGDAVNLEPAVTASQPLGGHFMQGHVDGVGVISHIQPGEDWRITVTPPAELMDYIVPKGSIALDGVSLTLAEVGPCDFAVALIPTTLDITTLGNAKVGDRLNLETDIITKSVVNFLQRHQSSPAAVTRETLANAGFID
jgi:riboflavin synthase